MDARGTDTKALVLVVDLDDIVRRTGSALEAFWTAASARWTAPLAALAPGRNALPLRERLEATALSLPSRLAYRTDALQALSEWRRRGGRTALVASCPPHTASAIAGHLDLFDEVHGLEAPRSVRADRLAALFGPGGYAEFDTATALPATLAPDLLASPLPAGPAEPPRPATGMPAALRLMRPHQWLKNLLIFVPVIAAHALTAEAFAGAFLAFVAFSLVASGTYVINDLLDLNADRAHPRKCHRPLASGAVSLRAGTLMAPSLVLLGLAVALACGLQLLGMVALYVATTLAYSFRFKRMVVIDICMLAVLYTMRILAGSTATGIPSSVWLLAFSIFFFFSLAAVKRQGELVDGIASGTVTAHGRGYHVDDLSIVSNIVVASGMVSVMVLALYANSAQVMELYARPEMLWGVCLVLLFWNCRIAILTQRGAMHDDPLVFAVKDRTSQLSGLAILALAACGTLL